jgi:hypothetical protein
LSYMGIHAKGIHEVGCLRDNKEDTLSNYCILQHIITY